MRKFPKKIRKMRGSRTCGYGRVGQHRGHGQVVGKGLTAQWKKSLYSYYLKQKRLGFPNPAWIHGSHGFKRPQDMVRIEKINTMNIKDLDLQIDRLVQENIATKSGNTYSINLDDLNIQKVLGRGEVNKKLNITVKKASKGALEKVEEAGGKIVLLSESK